MTVIVAEVIHWILHNTIVIDVVVDPRYLVA